jgi:hypothetical protein
MVQTCSAPTAYQLGPVPWHHLVWFRERAIELGMDTDTIEEYAYMAWQATQVGVNKDATIVAALWVRGVGMYLGSIPHGQTGTMPVQAQMNGMIRTQAPVLWSKVQSRVPKRGSIKWHAEDMAMYVYEKEERPTGPLYPPHSYMFAYGQYNGADRVGTKPPCGAAGRGAKIEPSCAEVLGKLSLEHMK